MIDYLALAEPFPAEDIEWRLQQCGKKSDGTFWGMALAYVTNRAVMQRLDDVCSPPDWRNEYLPAPGGGVLCGLSIRTENGEWVTKWDGAENTDTEAVKGGLSSAMKRAAVQWGIGRYLYDLPSGFVQIVDKGTKGALYGKTKENDRFYWLPPSLPTWATPEGNGATTAIKRAPKAVPTPPTRPPASAPKTLPGEFPDKCPVCNGPVWSNLRDERPNVRCKDKTCGVRVFAGGEIDESSLPTKADAPPGESFDDYRPFTDEDAPPF